MNERKFIKMVAEDEETRTRLNARVESILRDFAATEEVPLNELSRQQLQDVADGIVTRGLGKENR